MDDDCEREMAVKRRWADGRLEEAREGKRDTNDRDVDREIELWRRERAGKRKLSLSLALTLSVVYPSLFLLRRKIGDNLSAGQARDLHVGEKLKEEFSLRWPLARKKPKARERLPGNPGSISR